MSERTEPARDVHEYVSAAFRRENVAPPGDEDALRKIVAAGPRGAIVLAGLSVALLVAIWFAFFVFVFLSRGPIG